MPGVTPNPPDVRCTSKGLFVHDAAPNHRTQQGSDGGQSMAGSPTKNPYQALSGHISGLQVTSCRIGDSCILHTLVRHLGGGAV